MITKSYVTEFYFINSRLDTLVTWTNMVTEHKNYVILPKYTSVLCNLGQKWPEFYIIFAKNDRTFFYSMFQNDQYLCNPSQKYTSNWYNLGTKIPVLYIILAKNGQPKNTNILFNLGKKWPVPDTITTNNAVNCWHLG